MIHSPDPISPKPLHPSEANLTPAQKKTDPDYPADQPFKSMPMTNKELKMFWQLINQQIQTFMNKLIKEQKRASDEMKRSAQDN